MANIDVMYSSKTDQWATPDDFFKELDQEFHFNLDPCADEQNPKCEKYFTKEDNGLSKDWGGYRVFCNPPYGRAITDWVEKAYREGTKDNTIVVMLIPARKQPDPDADKLVSYPCIKQNTEVGVCGSAKAPNGALWYYIYIDGAKGKKYGYVNARYITAK